MWMMLSPYGPTIKTLPVQASPARSAPERRAFPNTGSDIAPGSWIQGFWVDRSQEPGARRQEYLVTCAFVVAGLPTLKLPTSFPLRGGAAEE